jgi:hypothetical protein
LEECESSFNSFDARQKDGTVALFYPFRGPSSNRISKHYNEARIISAIEAALEQGVDPYLTVAIMLEESPPTTGRIDPKVDSYEKRYGLIPIDEHPALAMLGCAAERKEPGTYYYLKPEQAEKWSRLQLEYNQAQDDFKTTLSKEKQTSNLSSAVDLFHSLEFRSRWSTWRGTQSKEEIEQIDRVNHVDPAGDVTRAAKLLDQAASENLRASKDRLLSANAAITAFVDNLATSEPDKKAGIIAELFTLMAPDPKTEVGFVKSPSKMKEFVISSPQESQSNYLVCAPSGDINTGFAPEFMVSAQPLPQGCCATLKAKFGMGSDELLAKFKGALGVKLLKQLTSPSTSDPSASLSELIQGYNGRGCIGCSEELKNGCLKGLNTKDRPIYGAEVADVMVNMLMSNAAIVGDVEKASAQLNKTVVSLACEKYGPGAHEIDVHSFLAEQEKYLLHGDDQPFLALLDDSEGHATFRHPASDADWFAYRRQEKARKAACKSLFINPWLR